MPLENISKHLSRYNALLKLGGAGMYLEVKKRIYIQQITTD